jgi:hypothetical protein
LHEPKSHIRNLKLDGPAWTRRPISNFGCEISVRAIFIFFAVPLRRTSSVHFLIQVNAGFRAGPYYRLIDTLECRRKAVTDDPHDTGSTVVRFLV